MTLEKDYLSYPHRSKGMDHDLYPYQPLSERAPVQWPDGSQLALWITLSLEFFPLTPAEGPRPAGHMVTPWPDLRTYTVRDYGNRVGVFRVLDRLRDRGLRASIPISSRLLERAPVLIERLLKDGHELIAMGADMNAVHALPLDPAREAERFAHAADALQAVAGTVPKGWMSPGRFETPETPRLMAEAGYQYHCDWVNDDMPYSMTTPAGVVTAMPYTHEIEDRHALVTLNQTLKTWCGSVLDAAKLLHAEAKQTGGGRMLHVGLTPYVIGQPFRIASLGPLLDDLLALGSTWTATGAEIEAHWRSTQ